MTVAQEGVGAASLQQTVKDHLQIERHDQGRPQVASSRRALVIRLWVVGEDTVTETQTKV